MADDKNVSVQVGPGFCGLLTILFIGLKLTNHIDWSWLWVLSPIWIPIAAACSIVVVILLIGVIAELFGKK